jgi:nucleotide-binding universal stress UspA family protein
MQAEGAAFEEAHRYVSGIARQLQEKGVRAKARVRYGDPVEEILNHVAWDHIDLIAMATHGRTGLTRVVMGNVAEDVQRRTPVPMLLMHAVVPQET